MKGRKPSKPRPTRIQVERNQGKATEPRVRQTKYKGRVRRV